MTTEDLIRRCEALAPAGCEKSAATLAVVRERDALRADAAKLTAGLERWMKNDSACFAVGPECKGDYGCGCVYCGTQYLIDHHGRG